MGTNFYWKHDAPPTVELPTGEEIEISLSDDHPSIHIGKRSAAGLYCWDCKQTLCMQGESKIHCSNMDAWFSVCPSCGAERKEQKDGYNPAMIELGFQEAAIEPQKGVQGVCSFTWAQDKYKVVELCRDKSDDVIVVDEYRKEYTGAEFLQMLEANCPVQFFDAIGRHFS